MRADSDEGGDRKTLIAVVLVVLVLGAVGGFYAMNGGMSDNLDDEEDGAVDYEPKEIPIRINQIAGSEDTPHPWNGDGDVKDLPWIESDDHMDCSRVRIIAQSEEDWVEDWQDKSEPGLFLVDFHGDKYTYTYEDDGEEYQNHIKRNTTYEWGVVEVLDYVGETSWSTNKTGDKCSPN